MDHEKPVTVEGGTSSSKGSLAVALHRRVDGLVLGDEAHSRILASVQHAEPLTVRFPPAFLLAAAACLLLAFIGIGRYWPSAPAEPPSRIKCVSAVYVDEARTVWSKKTIIVRTSNGKEGYMASAVQGSEQVSGTGQKTFWLPVLDNIKSLKAVKASVFLSKEGNWRTKTKIAHTEAIPVK